MRFFCHNIFRALQKCFSVGLAPRQYFFLIRRLVFFTRFGLTRKSSLSLAFLVGAQQLEYSQPLLARFFCWVTALILASGIRAAQLQEGNCEKAMMNNSLKRCLSRRRLLMPKASSPGFVKDPGVVASCKLEQLLFSRASIGGT